METWGYGLDKIGFYVSIMARLVMPPEEMSHLRPTVGYSRQNEEFDLICTFNPQLQCAILVGFGIFFGIYISWQVQNMHQVTESGECGFSHWTSNQLEPRWM